MTTLSRPVCRQTSTLCSIESGADASFSFDRSGCLVRAAWHGRMARWGLDGGALVKELAKPGVVARRRLLEPEAGLNLAQEAYALMAALLAQMTAPPAPPWDGVASRAAAAGPAFLQKRAAAYAREYSPVGILPPDQYGAMVLQLTTGCQWNRCSFCTFYKGQRFAVKSTQDFAQHIRGVRDMLGEAINRRQSIFLGSASALSLPFAELQAAFSVLARELPAAGRDQADNSTWPVFSFMDVFSAPLHQPEEYAWLAAHGLRRIYLGAESGSAAVLDILQKPVQPEMLLAAARAIKAGGVALGPVFLLGAGGAMYEREHAEATARLLAELPLDHDDTVFFSVLQPAPGSAYAAWERRTQAPSLAREQLQAQEQRMRQALRPFAAGGPRVTRYDVHEFVYY